MSSDALFDHFPIHLDQVLSSDIHHYQILRKLGSGTSSTTWLALEPGAKIEEHVINAFTNIKILTRKATQRHDEGHSHELDHLRKIKRALSWLTDGLPFLRNHFRVNGPEGEHLCFVTDFTGADVRSFVQTAPKQALPVHVVSNIVDRTLEYVLHLHELGIIHADLKLENFLFSCGPDTQIDAWRIADPTVFDGEVTVGGVPYPVFRAQPKSPSFEWNVPVERAELLDIDVVDLGHARSMDQPPAFDDVVLNGLSAPELILESDFGPGVDIWAIGCLTYELLTGHQLFEPKANADQLNKEHLLRQMMEVTGERFDADTLARAHLPALIIDEQNLSPKQPSYIERALEKYEVPKSKIPRAADFIQQCLHLRPNERLSAWTPVAHRFFMYSICSYH